ncbi:sodium:proton antiporter [Romeria aff. gracilis LEGE 07310]|uniref:Sodium:proton antiporter n=1 Tax=Vasconcelosia minhoensis LEGE 07310 TaxID=915328 RepID=A0A8J7A9K3_9CYAN|nr:sodium:proton antiporter [Romeria aff. gracilis LEGE 07310]
MPLTYIFSLLAIGLVLLVATLGSGWIARLPLSSALVYLIVGVLLGPYGIGLVQMRPEALMVQRLMEFVVIVSVFGCGLKMNRALKPSAWQSPIRLLGLLMPFSIVAIALSTHWLLGLNWGAAILLGAILAPTDPVLASEVQLAHVEDADELRFGLTSEGGLNDSLAFPFVYFGLFALKDSQWENWFVTWALVDFIWAIAAGIVMGIGVAKAVVWLDHRIQRRQPADDLMEDIVALSTILLTYSLTELVNGYGFLAVFIAGVVVQRNYYCDPNKRLAQLKFTEQMEKLLEVAAMIILGSLLLVDPILRYAPEGLLTAALLILLIRPLGALLSLCGSGMPLPTRGLFGWFGIRGVGSLYYLTYALGKGLSGDTAERLSWITYIVVVTSIIVHGVSASPLMEWYEHDFKSDPPLETDPIARLEDR